MLPSGTRQRSSRPHQAWRDLVHRTGLTRSQRRFALEVLSPIAGPDGIVRAGGVARLISRYCNAAGIASCSQRWITRLLTALVRVGLLEYEQHPGPGTPATYRLFAGRRMIVRPRGPISRHRHRAFMREMENAALREDVDQARRMAEKVLDVLSMIASEAGRPDIVAEAEAAQRPMLSVVK